MKIEIMTYKEKYELLVNEVEDRVIPSLLFYAQQLGRDIELVFGEEEFIFRDNESSTTNNEKRIIVGRRFDKKYLWRVHDHSIDKMEFLINEANKYAKIELLINECKKLVDINKATRKILTEKTINV